MNVIIWFDVAAACLLFIIWYVMTIRRVAVGRQIHDFRVAMFFVSVSTVTDFFATLMEYYAAENTDGILAAHFMLTLVSTVYYFCHMATIVAFLNYLQSVLSLDRDVTSRHLFIRDFPVLIATILILFNPFTEWIFFYDYQKTYHRGPLVSTIYIVALLYLAAFMAVLFKFRDHISRQKQWAMLFTVVFILGASAIQFFIPGFRIENFFNALACLVIYIFVESPKNYIDSITGLLSSGSFEVHSAVSFKQKRDMKLLLVSLDNLDEWESHVGKSVTDSLLIDVAGYMGALGDDIAAYRMRHHVFLLWFQSEDNELRNTVNQMLKDQFSDPVSIGEYTMVLSVCTLKIDCPGDVEDKKELDRAVSMMAEVYRHKNRREISFADLHFALDSRERRIDALLLEDILPGRFRFGWLPIYSTISKTYRFLDTDVLFNVPDVGEVRGSQFMPIAEKNGSVDRLFPFILENFCREFSGKNYESYGVAEFAVKLPKTQIIRQAAREQILEIVDKYKIAHSAVVFELAEDTILVYDNQIKEGIEALRDDGFRFVLNNYGYGYTNAEMLIRMPLVGVTLDNRLTAKGGNSKKADKILASTVALLKKLDMNVKCEHIENQKQLDYAKKLGCNLLQGYYFSWLLFDEEVDDFFAAQVEGGSAYVS